MEAKIRRQRAHLDLRHRRRRPPGHCPATAINGGRLREGGVATAATLVTCIVLAVPARSDDQGTQTWATTQLSLPTSDDLRLGFRYRRRFSDVFDATLLDQYQVTVSREVSDRARLTLGYEHFRSPRGSLEHRVFPQLNLRTHAGIELDHRLRIEYRDIDVLPEKTYRFRYQLSHTRPIGDTNLYLRLKDEVFLASSEVDGIVDRGFRQNRLGGALGARLGDQLRVEFAYDWAYTDSGVITRGDHLLQLNVIFTGRRPRLQGGPASGNVSPPDRPQHDMGRGPTLERATYVTSASQPPPSAR